MDVGTEMRSLWSCFASEFLHRSGLVIIVGMGMYRREGISRGLKLP